MKNNMVKALALLLSVNCCFPGILVNAEELEEKAETVTNLLPGANLDSIGDKSEILSEPLKIAELPQFDSNDIPSLLKCKDDEEEEKNGEAENLTEVSGEEKKKENVRSEDTGLKQLQIPQKLEVVIDPWEMDGKSQIYSEQYVIRNDGVEPGVLTLSNLACKVSGQSEAVVTTNRAGLHDGDEKLIYMQMIFGNGDQIDLSEDGSNYQVELQPGEELSVCFEGEVNEYASESWKDGDVAVTVVYSWDSGQTLENADEKENVSEDGESENGAEEVEETKKIKEDENMSRNVDLDMSDDEISKNEGEEQVDKGLQKNEGTTKEGEGIEENHVEEKKQAEETEGKTTEIIQFGDETGKAEEKENPEIIELREFEPIEFVIGKWERDDEGSLCSGWYLVKNEGEAEGVFVLSDLLYTDKEQNETDILREKEEVNKNENEPFHMEVVLESGKKIDITQKVLEKSLKDTRRVLEKELEENGYRVMLKPGEELKFQLVGEWDDADSEEIQKGNIMVKGIGFWDREEERNAE